MTLDRRLVVEALPSYEIGEEIGRGGWGVVLAAHHRELGRQVAIKQLPRAFAADPTVRLRFKEEARLIASLDHPHIVPVYDFVEKDGLCLIVMELMGGGTLWDRFVASGLPVDQACGQMLAAAAALHTAHTRGILHRDVKPENFLFTSNGVMKLGDFGIAKLLDDTVAGHTLSGQIIGTPAYMSPEQAAGETVGPYTDVYSVAVMLYELLTGELPFVETNEPLVQLMKRLTEPPVPIASKRADIPVAIAATVMQGLARQPGDRYATAQEFGESLARATTIAFGPGWLLRSGVEVLGAPSLVAVTATPVTGAGDGLPIAKQTVRPQTMHVRLGDNLDTDSGAPPQPIVPQRPPTPEPIPAAWAGPAVSSTPPPFVPPPPPPPPVGEPVPPPGAFIVEPAVPQPASPGPFDGTPDQRAPTVGPSHPTEPGPGPTAVDGAPPIGAPPVGAPGGPRESGPSGSGRGRLVFGLVAAAVVVAAVAVGAVLVVRSRSTTVVNGNGNEIASTSPAITNAQPGTGADSFVVTWTDTGDPSGKHTLYTFGDQFANATDAIASPTTAQLPSSGGMCFVLVRGSGAERSQPKCVNGGDESLVNMDQLRS